jgi:hypothetical protein
MNYPDIWISCQDSPMEISNAFISTATTNRAFLPDVLPPSPGPISRILSPGEICAASMMRFNERLSNQEYLAQALVGYRSY